MRFHCSILRARGKTAARTQSEEVFVPQAHLLEFQPKAGPRSGFTTEDPKELSSFERPSPQGGAPAKPEEVDTRH